MDLYIVLARVRKSMSFISNPENLRTRKNNIELIPKKLSY